MYRNKRDVDKHVENLLTKLTAKEFKSRAYSVARLYFEVGDYANCQKYVEQYLTQKDNNAAAYKLLGQALQKLGQKEKALEHYKTSLDIDPAQTSTILDICELLADTEVSIELGRAKYWCEKAEATFPRHPVTFRLRERLMAMSNPDPEALINLLTTELAIRPKDAVLHARLLKHYMHSNKIKEAFDHSCNIEFKGRAFINNYDWYAILNDILNHKSHSANDWLYQLLLLTVKERICLLSIADVPSGSSKSLIESGELLHAYDQAIEAVARSGASPGFGEFHSNLLQHHRGQFVFHAATLLLKKAKKDQLNWSDATRVAAPLMLIAWQTVPLDSNVSWLKNAPEKQLTAVKRWYWEGTYRCSQAGHYLVSNAQDKNQTFLDQTSQSFSGTHWRDKIYKKIFTSKSHLEKIKSSHFASSDASNKPVLRMPRKVEVEAYDGDAQREYGSSLHHFVWMLLNYKNYAPFKCTLFDMLKQTATSCGPENLSQLDIQAFLYCAVITARQQISNPVSYSAIDKPIILPANITDLLCSLPQMKWWDCAYKFSQNELGTELTDIRATLSRGIEVVRCIDNHGLDPELLCMLGRIFSERGKASTNIDEKNQLIIRAGLYYSSAIPLLEKLKSKMTVKVPEKRLFDFTHKELGTNELIALLEESKLYVALNYLNDGEYDKVIEMLSSLKSPQAYYHLGKTYHKIAVEENNGYKDNETKSKIIALLSKAKTFAYKTLDLLRDSDINRNETLYSDTQQLIEDIETQINKFDPDFSTVINDVDGKYSSDENVSGEHMQIRTNSRIFRNISSTPKAAANADKTNYRTAVDSYVLDNTRLDQKYLERIEREIKNLQKRDTTIDEFMDKTKNWFDENRKMGNQIISTIQTNMQNTTDQFNLLKISVNQVKDQIVECKNDCKDVGDLKKQIAELKKEVNKLKKASSEQNIDDSDLYNLDDEYRTNDSTSSFANPLPFTPSQVMPPFNQRLIPPFPIPPNPYQLYNQNLYNLYNQYTQFAQPSSVPGSQPIFDPTRGQMNYPGVYPTPDQMYLDVAHLVPPAVPAVAVVPQVPVVPPLSTVVPPVPTVTVPPPVTTSTKSKITSSFDKEVSRSLPVNVVITSSDPLPTCTTAATPILSVTIPQKHIKGTPHNYQIPMPSITETKPMSPPVFVFPAQTNKTPVAGSPLSNWNQASVFKTTTSMSSSSPFHSASNAAKLGDTLDTSKTVVDGVFAGSSPDTSLNKSRTLSERSNTSVENYDPCPDFKPIVPLPAEVKVTTGEENESVIFSSRAKLYRFVEKEWRERGLGEMKLLKHKITGKVRVLMRREQVHKICANHAITVDMEIKPMKNETKAYFWVANDFADETVVLEKFCVRFKTAEIALDFYNQFEKARVESVKHDAAKDNKISPQAPKIFGAQCTIPSKDNVEKVNSSSAGKAVFGGFTFSSTPTFKPVSENTNTDTKIQESPGKLNVFGTLSFSKSASAPFSSLFTTTDSAQDPPMKQTQAENKLNTSDTVEEFEPNVEFLPVVPLPALIEQKTGEEDETILFEHRAKLLRFDATTKEWKERGLGNIKLLEHKDNTQKVRLLMRREQIMKVCCNHAVTKEMVFKKMPNLDKAVTWCAKDFSEGELVSETFCLRFKTVQSCDDFIEAVKSAQSTINDESKVTKEETNTIKLTNQSGFGDSFKPKPGSWHCDICYTNNLESFSKCACCETPKPGDLTTDTNSKTSDAGWGDKFKPKPGSWECKDCFVRNEATLEYCSACNSSKDPTKTKPSNNLMSDTTPKFNFGIPKPETKPVSEKTDTKSIFGAISSETQFRFGIPPSSSHDEKSKSETSIFDGTGAHKFSFGVPVNNTVSVITAAPFGDQKPQASSLIVEPVTSVANRPLEKPALLSTPQKDGSSSFGFKESSSFGFVFKPKMQVNSVSPVKSPNNKAGDESDDNVESLEDSGNISFNPVIPLPDKVEVVTGEENETVLYEHPAKLYRFASGEWKERGRGIVHVLKHKDTGKLRVVMRRDQVLKICLNHALLPEITYTPKDEKSWLFAANDFSEGELSLQQFCLRFKNKDVAIDFKNAIDKARGAKVDDKTAKIEKDDDVVFVSETQATTEEKQMAKELMLPENFFTYKSKDPCQGCRGCKDDDDLKSTSDSTKNKTPLTSSTIIDSKSETTDVKSVVSTSAVIMPMKNPVLTSLAAATPMKTLTSAFQSPTTSVYGTPTNVDRTIDTSIFRTPSAAQDDSDSDTGFSEQKKLFGNLQNNSVTLFGGGDSQPAASTKSAVLAPPKLKSLNTSDENLDVDRKSIFGAAQNKLTSDQSKTIFGTINLGSSSNKSIFEFSDTKNVQGTDVKPSIFGGAAKTGNQFTAATQGSIFGSNLTNNQTSGGIFGSTGATVFGGGKSIFGNALSDFGKTGNDGIKATEAKTTVANNTKPEEVRTAMESDKTEAPFNVGNTLSFAALSSNTDAKSVFSAQKKPDFKWEGAGQQLFGGVKKASAVEGSKDESAGDEAAAAAGDEDYDPHYEPIVPLPDKIVVTTGEEDEEKLFGERCKLYRYDETSREWKERGVGEMKILYHPERNTYRLLLRREQVHKAVLNMLVYMDLELLQMKNSDRAWTWAGRNFAESAAGAQETLAVRFKSPDLANSFHAKVTECARKLQAAAAKAISEERESSDKSEALAPLRPPKHLQANAPHAAESQAHKQKQQAANFLSEERVSNEASVGIAPLRPPKHLQNTAAVTLQAAETQSNIQNESSRQVHFQELEEHDEEDDEYDQDYDAYYNEEDDESGAYYSCEGEAVIRQGVSQVACPNAYIQVLFDQEIYSPKILVTDAATGEILADMLIHTETEFAMNGDSCAWTGTDYTSNDPVDKTVTVNFFDSETAMQFYDSCETSKAASYSSMDPES